MFANGVTFMPILVGGQTFTLEAHGMHRLETAPEMHNIPSPFDDWTCEDFDRFERETWPHPLPFQVLGDLIDDEKTPETLPTTPKTEASQRPSSPEPPSEPGEENITAEAAAMPASSTNFHETQAPSDDLKTWTGVCVLSVDAGPQGSAAKKTRRKQRLSPLKADGSERPL
ncbi:hypothetical protein FRC16_004794, partial [Serendipita sp. 398]